MIYKLLRNFLFMQDSESVHDRSLELFSRYPNLSKVINIKGSQKDGSFESSFGWTNRIGLAAGFDKNALALEFWDKLGFGAIEIGTVTPRPQWGNEKKRIFRIEKDKALLNFMGFPSEGMNKVKKRVLKYQGSAALGVNIGKNKETPNSKAIDDYKVLFENFHNISDYIVVNISSPNTQGLRDLQNKVFLEELCQELRKISSLEKLCIKLAPDFNPEDLKDIFEVFARFNVGGVVATNTTSNHAFEKGGVSGVPLFSKSHFFIKELLPLAKESNLQIIACGGISHKSQLDTYQNLGINHFQVYSALIYEGPTLTKKLC